jgi:hypothetical protein
LLDGKTDCYISVAYKILAGKPEEIKPFWRPRVRRVRRVMELK